MRRFGVDFNAINTHALRRIVRFVKFQYSYKDLCCREHEKTVTKCPWSNQELKKILKIIATITSAVAVERNNLQVAIIESQMRK